MGGLAKEDEVDKDAMEIVAAIGERGIRFNAVGYQTGQGELG